MNSRRMREVGGDRKKEREKKGGRERGKRKKKRRISKGRRGKTLCVREDISPSPVRKREAEELTRNKKYQSREKEKEGGEKKRKEEKEEEEAFLLPLTHARMGRRGRRRSPLRAQVCMGRGGRRSGRRERARERSQERGRAIIGEGEIKRERPSLTSLFFYIFYFIFLLCKKLFS